MDHTPATPAHDDRPIRLLERTPVPEAHKARLLAIVRHAQALASVPDELQAEFGAEHVGLILAHNQFARLFRGGAHPGAVDLACDDAGKKALQGAGFTLGEPEGAVFRMFGWVRVDVMSGPEDVLMTAVAGAMAKARAMKK